MLYKSLIFLAVLFACQERSVLPPDEEFPQQSNPASIENGEYSNRFLISDRVQKKINKYEAIVKKYSKRYGFDWRLIMAQIRQESSYNEKARSHVGAKGLMQIMPGTATEIRSELDIEYIYLNPRENIAAGIFHLYKQYNHLKDIKNPFDRMNMTLAAYNSGLGRIRDARQIARVLYNNDQRWEFVSKALEKLTPENWRIHLQVWPSGKPAHGYFKGSDETISYVKNINLFYATYKKFY